MRNFSIVAVEQRSPAWFQARCGRLTGSRAADMVAAIKTGEAAARRDLRMQLVCERLTGASQEDGYVNAAMQRGLDLESTALGVYEGLTGQVVSTVGFLSHTSLMSGCSPDGYVGDFETLVSLKCPKSATHLRYLRGGGMPSEHKPQMLHELWTSGAQAYDFLSYDDRFPESLQVFYVRVARDNDAVAEYEQKALAFLAEVDREVEAVATMADVGAVLRQAVSA